MPRKERAEVSLQALPQSVSACYQLPKYPPLTKAAVSEFIFHAAPSAHFPLIADLLLCQERWSLSGGKLLEPGPQAWLRHLENTWGQALAVRDNSELLDTV